MDELYVTISAQSILETDESKIPEDSLKFVAGRNMIEKTYEDFLQEVYVSSQSENAPSTYDLIGEMFSGRNDVEYHVSLFNRNTMNSEKKNLDDVILETAGNSIYTATHNIRGRERSLKTLEIYVSSEGIGGNDAS